MARVYPILASDTANAPGAGAITLLGVAPTNTLATGLTLVSQLSNGDVSRFTMVDSTDKSIWETFLGTYTTSGTSLARTTTKITSAGNATPINFTHAVNVYCDDLGDLLRAFIGLTNHGVVLSNGVDSVAGTGAGTAGQVLTSNGASADPTFNTNPIGWIGGFRNASLAQNTTKFFPPGYGTVAQASSLSEPGTVFRVMRACTLKNLYFSVNVAVGGSAQTAVATIMVNGSAPASGPAVTLNTGSASGSDTTNSCTLAIGDYVEIRTVTSATTGTLGVWSWNIEMLLP